MKAYLCRQSCRLVHAAAFFFKVLLHILYFGDDTGRRHRGGTSTLFYLKAAPQLPLRASDGGDGS